MQYSIPECNIESLEKKLTKIRNKCAKYGCEFKYQRIGEHFEEIERDHEDSLGRVIREKETVKFIDINVEGQAAVNGWRFAASLEYTDKGNLIAGYGDLEIPERYYSCSPWCEHCKTRRDRKNSYIVYNEETGEFKQVGKSCLRDFTGGLSAENVARFESYFKEIEEASEYGWGGGFGRSYFDVEKFMACAAETIRIYGYVKRESKDLSTASRTEDMYRVEFGMRLPWGCEKEMRAQYDEAVARGWNIENPESVKLAAEVREWISNNERSDNYFHNLKVACSLKYGGGEVLGLLVSAFPTYNRELEFLAEKKLREEREKEAAAKSSWMGDVGDRVSFKIADYRVISSRETQWGTTCVYKLVDEDGREATWKTSNWIDEHCIGGTIKGTVKELKEFRGIKQTELTRCKVTMPERKKAVEKRAEYDDSAEKAFGDFMAYCDGKVG